MKMKNLIYAMVIIMLMACSKKELDESAIEPDAENKNDIAQILPDEHKVNSFELENVIGEFCGEQDIVSRASNYTITSINDENGNPAIYVVNFHNNGGFVLVSAVKDYYPVLAYNTKGNFEISSSECCGALNDWTKSTVSFLSNVDTLPSDSIKKYHKIWNKYEYKYEGKSKCPIMTRSFDDYDKVQTIFQDTVNSWMSRRDGSRILWFGEKITDNEQRDQELWGLAQSSIWPEYEEDWEKFTIGLYSEESYSSTVGGPLKTKWGQGTPFNCEFPIINGYHAVAGCATIAAAQIMYHHLQPSEIDWNEMPTERIYPYSNNYNQLSKFLYIVAAKSKAKFVVISADDRSTPISLDNLVDTFKSYNYYAKTTNEIDMEVIKSNINQNRPVILGNKMYSLDKQKYAYHAFVVSGYSYSWHTTKAELWTFRNRLKLEPYETIYGYVDLPTYYLINWGEYGMNDGYFSLPNAVPSKDYKDGELIEMVVDIHYTK